MNLFLFIFNFLNFNYIFLIVIIVIIFNKIISFLFVNPINFKLCLQNANNIFKIINFKN